MNSKIWLKNEWKKKNNNIHVTTYMQQHTAAGSETSYEVLWFVDNPVFNVELLKQLKWKHKLCDNRECRLLYLKILRTNFNHTIKTWIYFSQRNVSTSIQYPPTHIYLSQETSYSPPGVLWALLSTVTYNWRISTRRKHANFLKLQQ